MQKIDTSSKRVGCWGGYGIEGSIRMAKDLMENGKHLKAVGRHSEALGKYAEAAGATEHYDAERASRIHRAVAKGYEKIGEHAFAGVHFEKAAQTKTVAAIVRGAPKGEMAEISGLYLEAVQNFLVAAVKNPGQPNFVRISSTDLAQHAWVKAMEFSQDFEATSERLKMVVSSICGVTISDANFMHDLYGAFASLRGKP
ncbi:Uncharacterised protein [uncultured archaeon]|nr:Uncharacterised protein [uncultured archaeon]